ncbi:N-acetyltransferase 5 [Rhodotorula kratochvilovae]
MSAVLAALPDLPALVEPATTLNGKRIRVPPRVNLGDLTPNNLGTVKKLHNVLFPVSYSPQFYDALLDPSQHPEEYNKLVFYQDLPVGVLVCRLEESKEAAPRTLSEAAAAREATGKEGDKDAKGKEGEPKAYKLYVMTLGVLAPYRHQGLGSKLIHQALSSAAASHVPPPSAVTSSSSKPTPAPAPAPAKGKKPAPPAKKDAGKEKEEKKEDEEVELPKPRVESVYLHVQVGNDEGRRFWEKWGFEVKETVPDYYRKIEPRDAWLLERRIEPSLTPVAPSA